MSHSPLITFDSLKGTGLVWNALSGEPRFRRQDSEEGMHAPNPLQGASGAGELIASITTQVLNWGESCECRRERWKKEKLQNGKKSFRIQIFEEKEESTLHDEPRSLQGEDDQGIMGGGSRRLQCHGQPFRVAVVPECEREAEGRR